jgi:hypothetical protein
VPKQGEIARRPAWPEDTVVRRPVLDVESDSCEHCGATLHVCGHRFHRIHTLQGPVELPCRLAHCSDCLCPLRCQTLRRRVAIRILRTSVRHTEFSLCRGVRRRGPIDGTDSSSLVPLGPSPGVEPSAKFVNTSPSIVGRLDLGTQPRRGYDRRRRRGWSPLFFHLWQREQHARRPLGALIDPRAE